MILAWITNMKEYPYTINNITALPFLTCLKLNMVGHLLFLLYMNDLPMIINNKSIPVLFAADTSIVFIHSDFIAYKNNISTLFETYFP
jgi:hypothetical protein